MLNPFFRDIQKYEQNRISSTQAINKSAAQFLNSFNYKYTIHREIFFEKEINDSYIVRRQNGEFTSPGNFQKPPLCFSYSSWNFLHISELMVSKYHLSI